MERDEWRKVPFIERNHVAHAIATREHPDDPYARERVRARVASGAECPDDFGWSVDDVNRYRREAAAAVGLLRKHSGRNYHHVRNFRHPEG